MFTYIFVKFGVELLKTEAPDTFEKEPWLLSESEKRDMLPKLKESGNAFYQKSMYKEAEEKYTLALGFLEQIMMK